MGKHTARKEFVVQLGSIRREPGYYSGELIDTAADIALNVGRPARRLGSFRAGRQALAGAQVDYEAMNAAYETELISTSASGWEKESL